MKIGLLDVDGHNFPNLALMKIKSYYGKQAEWYSPFQHYDIVYQSKVFTFTADYQYFVNADKVQKGGSGYNLKMDLFCDSVQPDLTLYKGAKFYNAELAYGFLTRGCPNNCSWCIVPKKEGKIQPYNDIEQVAQGKTKVILMDNNILASEYGLQQIEKIVRLGLRVDFNQAMDSRLVTEDVAKLLARVKWLNEIRFGCDTPQQVETCKTAIERIRKYNKLKTPFLLYTIIKGDKLECYERTKAFRNDSRIKIFAQPYSNFTTTQNIPQWQKDMAHWANRRWLYSSIDFTEFKPRKDFCCSEYFSTK